jgi:hypothetical protein
MNNLIELLLRLIGRERSIETITSAGNKVIRDLDNLAARHQAKHAAAAKRAALAAAQAEQNRFAAEDAAELSSNWKNSGLVRPSRKAA